MGKKLSEEKQEKIREAHEMKMTLEKAAEYAGVSHMTVKNYWKRWELETHGKVGRQIIDEDKKIKMREAHGMRMSQRKAAEYAGVSQTTVGRYWKCGGWWWMEKTELVWKNFSNMLRKSGDIADMRKMEEF